MFQMPVNKLQLPGISNDRLVSLLLKKGLKDLELVGRANPFPIDDRDIWFFRFSAELFISLEIAARR